MNNKPVSILSTADLPEYLLSDTKNFNIDLDVLPFIQIEPIETVDVHEEIEQALLQSTHVVFTSIHALRAVAEKMDGHLPNWKIYTTEPVTSKIASKIFGEEAIHTTAMNSAELAGKMIEEDIEEVIFFCGTQRREELPALLREHGVDLTEIVVYETIATPHLVQQQYHGILFFSPSAVESYFSVNTWKDKTIPFAIGSSTEQAIKKYCDKKIIVSNQPGKDELVRIAIEYFT